MRVKEQLLASHNVSNSIGIGWTALVQVVDELGNERADEFEAKLRVVFATGRQVITDYWNGLFEMRDDGINVWTLISYVADVLPLDLKRFA